MPRKPNPLREPPIELDGDYKPTDLADALRALQFDNGNHAFHAVKLDQDVRDFLVAALRVRHVTPSPPDVALELPFRMSKLSLKVSAHCNLHIKCERHNLG